jgi:hypothetical protein
LQTADSYTNMFMMISSLRSASSAAGTTTDTTWEWMSQEDCLICHMPFVEGESVSIMVCRHKFHTECLNQWLLGERRSCPVCRSDDIRNVRVVRHSQPHDRAVAVTPRPNIQVFDVSSPATTGTGYATAHGSPSTAHGADEGMDEPSMSASSIDTSPGLSNENGGSSPVWPWWPVEANTSDPPHVAAGVYHAGTSIPGKVGLIVDTGAWGNLAGSDWVRSLASCAVEAGFRPQEQRMPKPLVVSGVGKHSQECHWETVLPIALPRADGQHSVNTYTSPVVPNSQVPGLLGLRTMINKRAIVDTVNRQLHLCGPGPVELTLPPGTESFKLEQSPSGHFLLPVSEFQAAKRSAVNASRLEPRPPQLHLPVVFKSSCCDRDRFEPKRQLTVPRGCNRASFGKL